MIGLVDRHGWKKKIEGWFQPGYVVNDTQASSSVTCDPHTSVSGKSIMTPSDQSTSHLGFVSVKHLELWW